MALFFVATDADGDTSDCTFSNSSSKFFEYVSDLFTKFLSSINGSTIGTFMQIIETLFRGLYLQFLEFIVNILRFM